MVTRKTSQLCQHGKGKEMGSSCGFQAFHSGPELNVFVEIDSRQLYLFSTICSGHVYCLASSSTRKMRATGQTVALSRHFPWTDTHSCRTPTEPDVSLACCEISWVLSSGMPTVRTTGMGVRVSLFYLLGYLPCQWLGWTGPQ